MTSPSSLILTALRDGKEFSLHELVQTTGQQADALRRVLVELEEKALVRVTREKIDRLVLTPTGIAICERKLFPEEILYSVLVDVKSVPFKKAMADFQVLAIKYGSSAKESVKEFTAAFGLCKRKNFVEVIIGGDLVLTPLGKIGLNNIPEKKVLEAIFRGENPSDNPKIISELHARGLITSKSHTTETIQITSEGKAFLSSGKKLDSHANQLGLLTPQMLASGTWKNASFKPYDVTLGVEERFPGRIHPLRNVMRDVRQIMVELGFEEMDSGLVESAFWNMDAMFIPQDHPAREVQDTFYLPGKAVLENAELIKRVKAMHEHGGKTGSKGFGYDWDPRVAEQLLLRTHTTATTFRELSKSAKHPQKKFAIGRIFRNEAIDATHLAEFHQVEGYIMGEGLTLRHLMGIITEFYSKLGLTKIRFKPTYNPYTEPSMEAAAYNPQLGKWVELINSGMFRKESLAPFGIDVPVIAWGFGLERLALFMYEKSTLREIMGPDVDVDFIRNYPFTQHQLGVNKHG